MSALRASRTALRAGSVLLRPALQAQRRGYADVASDKIQLSLTLPHQVCYPVKQRLYGLRGLPYGAKLTALCYSLFTSQRMCKLSQAPGPIPSAYLRDFAEALHI